MNIKQGRDQLFISILIIFGCLFLYNSYKAIQESRALNSYIDKIPGLSTSSLHESAIIISESLRNDFNVNSATWNTIPNHKEPLLKYSALNLLKWKEGHCGKGSRVLVLLLHKLGINATRVTLYGKDFTNRSSHTLVSILIKGKEYLIDSINSNEEWNASIKSKEVSTSHLFPSSKSIKTEPIVKHSYVNYSYETYPFVLFSKGLRLKTIYFNHTRPASLISWLMESVYVLKCIFFLVLTLMTSTLWYFIAKRHKKKRIELELESYT